MEFVEVISSFSPTTLLICLFILIMFVWDLATLNGNHLDFRSLIVTVGIFGTFLGILLGLLEFDTLNIEGSVPPLLEGMKTAFLTSVFGLGASGALTFIALVTGKEDDSEAAATRSLERKLQELLDETKTGFKVTNYNLEQALNKLAEGATAGIIEALNAVIADFNRNLKEQFGDNFKQLNEAVFKLVDWQVNYSAHVENSTAQLSEATSNIKRAIESTIESTTAIDSVKESIERVLYTATEIQNQTTLANQALEAQKRILTDFDTLFIQFKNNLQATASQTTELTDNIKNSLSTQSESLNQLTGSIKEKLPESLGQLEKTLTGLTQKFGDDYRQFLEATAVLIRNAQR